MLPNLAEARGWYRVEWRVGWGVKMVGTCTVLWMLIRDLEGMWNVLNIYFDYHVPWS
jgi:hypothetical protein